MSKARPSGWPVILQLQVDYKKGGSKEGRKKIENACTCTIVKSKKDEMQMHLMR